MGLVHSSVYGADNLCAAENVMVLAAVRFALRAPIATPVQSRPSLEAI